MVQLVSDDVWRQLDPYTGQLSPRTVRRLRWAVVTTVLLILLAVAFWRSGVVVPMVNGPDDTNSWSADTQTRRIEYTVTVRNDGWVPAEIVGAGRDGPGLDLLEVRGAFPTTLEPGTEMELVIVYRVTDCAAVPATSWPVPVRVSRPWGVYTANVTLPYLTSPDAPDGMREYAGRDPYAREWQQVLTDVACTPR